jgi:two-component system, NarL family, response regulator NreC
VSETGEVASEKISVVLADDHAVVRSALRLMLEREPDIEVVAEAGDADSAGRYVSGHRPKVLILDINMPGGSGLAAIPAIREQSPGTEIVVLTMQDETAFAREALQAGVLGYILKEAASEELVKAVRMAAEGRTYLQPELGARLAAEPDAATPDDLSERELEVLRLIALGHTNNEIAEQLYLSVRTVESHRAHIQQKLAMTTRSELVRYAIDRGLIDVWCEGAPLGATRFVLLVAGRAQRNLGADRRPRPRVRLDPQRSSEQRNPLTHPDQPEPLTNQVGLEADTVVRDLDLDLCRELPHLELRVLRPRVLRDVVERLLHQPVDRRFQQRRRPLLGRARQLELAVDPDLAGLLMLLREGVECRLQPDRVE